MTRPEFDLLVRQLSRKLYGFAFRILRNREEAEDVVQETFIKLWNMEEKLKEFKSIEALATTMTRNYCIDILRRQKPVFSGDLSIIDYNDSTSPSPLDLMEKSESRDILNEIVGNLPDSYKEIIQMRDIEGESYEEIAAKTNQNINTLRVTLSRARKYIREEFNKYQYERRGIEKAAGKVL